MNAGEETSNHNHKEKMKFFCSKQVTTKCWKIKQIHILKMGHTSKEYLRSILFWKITMLSCRPCHCLANAPAIQFYWKDYVHKAFNAVTFLSSIFRLWVVYVEAMITIVINGSSFWLWVHGMVWWWLPFVGQPFLPTEPDYIPITPSNIDGESNLIRTRTLTCAKLLSGFKIYLVISHNSLLVLYLCSTS